MIHEKVMHFRKPEHKCTLCDKVFVLDKYLKMHVKAVHTENLWVNFFYILSQLFCDFSIDEFMRVRGVNRDLSQGGYAFFPGGLSLEIPLETMLFTFMQRVLFIWTTLR